MTNRESIRVARYIKLGRGGEWAENSIAENRLRFGWGGIPLNEIYEGQWDSIRSRLEQEHSNKATVTNDLERLRDLVSSGSDDVWITFHDSHLWWARLTSDPVMEDAISKYRIVREWHNADVKGKPLVLSRVPGTLAQLQAYRSTVCRVHDQEALERLINAEFSEAYRFVDEAYATLISRLTSAIQRLHWKDFEVLVDLVFRQAGWRRRSMLGESMKYVDLELEEPITGEAYQVQIKARASAQDFRSYVDQFSKEGFRKLFFVVHTPTKDLLAESHDADIVDLILPERLANLVAEAGLVRWVLDKVQ